MPKRITGFLVPLVGLAAFFVLYAFLVAYKYTLRPLLEGLAWFLDKIKIHAWKVHIDFGPWLAGKIRDVEHWVRNEIARGVLHSQRLAVRWLHALSWLFSLLGKELGRFANEVLHTFRYLRHHLIPKLIRAVVHLINRLISKLWKWVRHFYKWAVREITHLWKWTRHVVAALYRDLAKAWRFVRHLYHWAVHEFAQLWKLSRWLYHQLSAKNLKRLLLGLFTDLGLAWMFGRNIIEMAGAVLGWSYHMLRAFVRWITRLEETPTIPELVHVSQQFAVTTVKAMHWYLKEYDETITTGEVPIPPVE